MIRSWPGWRRCPACGPYARALDVTELTVTPGTDPQSILHAALARGAQVTCFEIADASLEDVFIELVGRPPEGDGSADRPAAVEPAA